MSSKPRILPKSVTDRSRGIGGTDAGIIFGFNKYTSLPQLWLQKTGKLPKQESAGNEFMEWGTLLEAPIARKFAQKTGRRIQGVKHTLQHPEYPWMIGNPDRLQWDRQRPVKTRRGILEVKCTMFSNMRAWQKGGVPATYYLQVQHYLCVTGLEWASFAVLFGGNTLVEFDVQRDDDLIKLMIERERDFWELVQTNTMPAISLSASWNAELAKYFPTATKGKEIVLSTPEAIGHARRLFALKEQLKRRELELAQHEVWLKLQLGEADAEKLLIPSVGRFSWTVGERKTIDIDKLRAEHPGIAKALTLSTPQRTFRGSALEDIEEDDDDESAALEPAVYGLRRIELD